MSIPVGDSALPRPGSTALTRSARTLTGGPGSRLYGLGQSARGAWWAVLDGAERMRRGVRPAPGPDLPGTAVRRYDGGRVRAVVDAAATPQSVHDASLVVVVEALRAHDVDFFAVPDAPGRVRLAVAETDSGATSRALADAASRTPLQLGLSRHGREVGLRGAAAVPASRLRESRAVGAVVPATDPDGRGVIAAAAGVEVEFWRPVAGGGLGAPVRNRFGPVLDPGTTPRAVLDVGGLSLPSFEPLLERHPDDVPFPVDAVYTWVDGGDPQWRARMTAARDLVTGGSAAHATAEARFRGLDELRYSLRAIEANAPWLRHIWLVTDAQVPAWLRTDHPRLTVVDHRDIWVDPALLPVFNSHAIESQLHRIEGLAEHYVYFNDDVFLGRPVPPTAFFDSSGLARFYPSSAQVGIGARRADDAAPAAAAKNGRALLRAAVGVAPTQKLIHVPHAQRRSVAYELAERFPEDYGRVAGSTFRSVEDISPVWLQVWYAQATARAVAAALDYRYLDVVRPGAFRALKVLARRRDLDVFCLNQSEDAAVDPARLEAVMADFLRDYYPFRSAFERD